MKRIFPGPDHMSFEINRILVVGSDGENSDLVAILNLERLQSAWSTSLGTASCGISRLSMVCFSCATTRCTSMCRRVAVGSKPPARADASASVFLVFQLVNRRTPNHAFDCDFRTERRNHDRVAIFQSLHVALTPCSSKIVNIDILHQLVSAIVFQNAQRAAARGPACGKQAFKGVESEPTS